MAWKRVGECSQCGKCCEYIQLTFEKIISRDLIKYYKYHDIKTKLINGKSIITIPIKCKHLGEDGKCKIYGKGRPIVCLKYPESPDEWRPKECTFDFVKE